MKKYLLLVGLMLICVPVFPAAATLTIDKTADVSCYVEQDIFTYQIFISTDTRATNVLVWDTIPDCFYVIGMDCTDCSEWYQISPTYISGTAIADDSTGLTLNIWGYLMSCQTGCNTNFASVQEINQTTKYHDNITLCPCENSPTITPTWTASKVCTPTPTFTITKTPVQYPSNTPQKTKTITPTRTKTCTPTFTPQYPTSTRTITPTRTPVQYPSNTPQKTKTITPTRTPSRTATTIPQNATFTRTITPTRTIVIYPSNTPVQSKTFTATQTKVCSPTITNTFVNTATFTITPTFTITYTPNPTNTISGYPVVCDNRPGNYLGAVSLTGCAESLGAAKYPLIVSISAGSLPDIKGNTFIVNSSNIYTCLTFIGFTTTGTETFYLITPTAGSQIDLYNTYISTTSTGGEMYMYGLSSGIPVNYYYVPNMPYSYIPNKNLYLAANDILAVDFTGLDAFSKYFIHVCYIPKP
jgi:hypothetical protein